jgi:hypothetical protein
MTVGLIITGITEAAKLALSGAELISQMQAGTITPEDAQARWLDKREEHYWRGRLAWDEAPGPGKVDA